MKFNNTQVVRRSNRFRALSSDQVSILEAPVTEYLVREAAWACGHQILDDPLMVNEIIDWCKNHKKKLMVLKVDFEKAFDSVCWEFLNCVMSFMGFGEKWISWIRGCLYSAKAYVLVNGNPTVEFSLHRGLRQGDPHSLFIFILVMVPLHVAIEDAIATGFF
ncbi:uncharacterized protein LOC128127336 [Lactuca sativa]|uniref:uncharacterized protein LOC128127336 n=1 Tax=Lactuca sativa TaxID=4236 RepID=UPI000CD91B9F|nr:uncharacterized protein LOC128127336 [Lactuca sativa]